MNESTKKVDVKERLKLAFKFLLVFGVFYFLYKKGLITGESFKKLFASPGTLIACTLLMAANVGFGALRWQVLLRTQDANLSFWEVLKLNMVGSFFNVALPGAVSGDLIKAVHVSGRFPEKRAQVFGSMLFDRLLGVSAMVFVGTFAAVLSLIIPWGGHLPPVLLYAVGGVGFGLMLFFVYLFLSHRNDPVFSAIQFVTKRHEKLSMIDRLYLGVMSYRAYPGRVLKAIAFSVMIHLLLVTMAFIITETISTGAALAPFAVAVVVPIGILATTVPVLPAGVGTGHAAFFALYKMIGSDQGAEVFSLIVFFTILTGIVGGVVYLKVLYEKKHHRA